MNFVDLTGKRFGRLIVLEKNSINNSSGHIRWRCKCDCGNEKVVTGYDMRIGHIKSCGCFRKEKNCQRNNNFHPSWNGYEGMSGTQYNVIRANARRRHIIFNVSIKYLWDLFLKQNKKCALTGIPLIFETRCAACDGNASLDRIDSSKGYIEGNVQWTHKEVNVMKLNHDLDHFVELCRKVVEYYDRNKKIV